MHQGRDSNVWYECVKQLCSCVCGGCQWVLQFLGNDTEAHTDFTFPPAASVASGCATFGSPLASLLGFGAQQEIAVEAEHRQIQQIPLPVDDINWFGLTILLGLRRGSEVAFATDMLCALGRTL